MRHIGDIRYTISTLLAGDTILEFNLRELRLKNISFSRIFVAGFLVLAIFQCAYSVPPSDLVFKEFSVSPKLGVFKVGIKKNDGNFVLSIFGRGDSLIQTI